MKIFMFIFSKHYFKNLEMNKLEKLKIKVKYLVSLFAGFHNFNLCSLSVSHSTQSIDILHFAVYVPLISNGET